MRDEPGRPVGPGDGRPGGGAASPPGADRAPGGVRGDALSVRRRALRPRRGRSPGAAAAQAHRRAGARGPRAGDRRVAGSRPAARRRQLPRRPAERRLLLRDIVLSILAVAFLVLPTVLEPAAVIWVVLLLVAAEVIYAEAVVSTWGVTARRFVRGSFDPQEELDRGASMRDALAQVAQAQDGNVTVYSGFSPFVGAGFDVGGWSFALNISRGRERFGTVAAPRRFELTELYEHVSGAIDSLGLSGLSIEDRLYVDGRELRRDGLFLDAARARPLTMADPATVAG